MIDFSLLGLGPNVAMTNQSALYLIKAHIIIKTCYRWGSENRVGSPNTRFLNKRTKVRTREGTRNPRKSASASKVVNAFARALEPPFIGRRRDFYFPRLPSNLKNIRGVNMYMNIFYIP
jgi:hypothetical protein